MSVSYTYSVLFLNLKLIWSVILPLFLILHHIPPDTSKHPNTGHSKFDRIPVSSLMGGKISTNFMFIRILNTNIPAMKRDNSANWYDVMHTDV